MSKKAQNESADRLRQIVTDYETTAAEVERIENELSQAREQLSKAQDLHESDSIMARIEALTADIQRATTRANVAHNVLAKHGPELETRALQMALQIGREKFSEKERELDAVVVAAATSLLEAFAKRRELESEAHNFIYEATPHNPFSMGDCRLQANPLRVMAGHILRYSQALRGIDETFCRY